MPACRGSIRQDTAGGKLHQKKRKTVSLPEKRRASRGGRGQRQGKHHRSPAPGPAPVGEIPPQKGAPGPAGGQPAAGKPQTGTAPRQKRRAQPGAVVGKIQISLPGGGSGLQTKLCAFAGLLQAVADQVAKQWGKNSGRQPHRQGRRSRKKAELIPAQGAKLSGCLYQGGSAAVQFTAGGKGGNGIVIITYYAEEA